MKIIVSFTSYPQRIKTIYQVIESLRKQTIQADKIILWLSIEEFPNKELDLPENLISIDTDGQFEIRWVADNLKSHKKYYYALQEFQKDVVITVDDDTYYESTMIELLMKSYEIHPFAISARNVHRIYSYKNRIAPYCTWNYCADERENIESLDLCAIGVGAILYPPNCSNSDWFNKNQILSLAENQDDLWLKFQQIQSGIPVVYVKSKYNDCTIKGSQKISLMSSNIKKDNDICIQKLCQYYYYAEVIKKWILDLQEVKAILLDKKKKCIQKLIFYRGREIIIFGAGKYAKYLFLFMKEFVPEITIEYFLVSNKKGNPNQIDGIPVLEVKNLSKKKSHIIFLGVSEKVISEIDPIIHSLKNDKWVAVDMLAIKQVYQGIKAIEEYKVNGISYSSSI